MDTNTSALTTNDKILWDECYSIIGAAMRVHNNLGCGFLEAVYQEALVREFLKRRIPFEQQKELVIYYDGVLMNKRYYADFVCYDNIIVELKACDGIAERHRAQVMNYLKATQMRVGLLLNFGLTKLQFVKFVN